MKRLQSLLPLLLILLTSTHAFARLGGAESSTEADRQAFHGIRRVTLHANYKVHEITTTGGAIREYVSTNGTVFAVAWKGVAHPDLTQLFGPYYTEYAQADRVAVKPAGRAEVNIATQNLRAARFGHMRAVRGRAWLPALVPPGFDMSQIQ